MTEEYSTNCGGWNNFDLFRQKNNNRIGGLRLENVDFYNIRSQYSSLIKMKNSPNLTMINVNFEKVQAKKNVSVIHV